MKNSLIPSDFKECPIWRYDEDSDAYFPVQGEKDLPERVRDLSLLAEFITPSGIKILGEIEGVEHIFAVGLFFGEKTFFINKNMPERAREQAEEFLTESGLSKELSYETLFPLRYETKWGGPVFNDFSGVFEMPPEPASKV